METIAAEQKQQQPTGRIIKARKVKDGFTFQLSIDHIIEQTLLKEYNSPKFRKSTIKIEEKPNSDGAESDDSLPAAEFHRYTTRTKGVPIKLQLKRQYGESTPCTTPEGGDSQNSVPQFRNPDEPLDMTTKKVRSVIVPREPKKPVIEQITAIPPQWIMRGLTRNDHIKFQGAVSRASLSPYQIRNRTSAESQV